MKKILYFLIAFFLTLPLVSANMVWPTFSEWMGSAMSMNIILLFAWIVVIEVFVYWIIVRRYYKKKFDLKKNILIVFLANVISMLLGFYINAAIASFIASFIESPFFFFLMLYILTVLIEWGIFFLFYRKTWNRKELLKMTALANVFSYLFLYILMVVLSI